MNETLAVLHLLRRKGMVSLGAEARLYPTGRIRAISVPIIDGDLQAALDALWTKVNAEPIQTAAAPSNLAVRALPKTRRRTKEVKP